MEGFPTPIPWEKLTPLTLELAIQPLQLIERMHIMPLAIRRLSRSSRNDGQYAADFSGEWVIMGWIGGHVNSQEWKMSWLIDWYWTSQNSMATVLSRMNGVSSYGQQPCQGGGASIFGFEWRATARAKISYYQWRTGRVWPLRDCR